MEVDTTAPEATIDIDIIAGDDVINQDESGKETTTVTGTVGKDVKPGDTVTVTVEGSDTQYTAKVTDDLTWSVEVSTSDLVAGKEVHASVTTTDEAGNSTTATDERPVEVDTTAPGLEIEDSTVFEAGLDNGGSDAGSDKESTCGTIEIFGDASKITIGDKEFILDEHGNANIIDGTINTKNGTLEITSIKDGHVNYTYTLDKAVTHDKSKGEDNELSDNINVTVTDQAGNTISGSLTIIIIDDVPTIVHDKTTSLVPGDDPFIISEGTVTVDPGADGFASDYQNTHAKFDLDSMVDEGSLSDDGMSGTITVLIDGIETQVTVKLSENSDKSILTGTIEDSSDPLFEATLDKEGNWSMEQYEQFHMPSDDGSSNQFELVFKTEDGDGDVATTTVNVPLEVKEQGTNGNGGDTIIITGGDGVAGTVAAGDSGGMTEGQQVEANYNVCFILDTSGSMDDKVNGYYGDSRLDVAVKSIENFIENSIHNGDFAGEVNLAVVPFATSSNTNSIIEVSISRESDGDGGYTEQYTFDGYSYSSYEDFMNAFSNALEKLYASGGTNYEAGFRNAAGWFEDLGGTSEADGNITYFLTDGKPTYCGNASWWDEGNGSNSSPAVMQGAWEGYQDLLDSAANMQVNAIGFGKNLSQTDMENLAMFDNTGKGEGDTYEATGVFETDGGQYSPNVEYRKPEHIDTDETYYVQLGDGSWQEVKYQWHGIPGIGVEKGWGYYYNNFGQWTSVNKDDLREQVFLPAEGGVSQKVTDADSLTAAFESGFKPGALVGVGDDIITAASSSSSAIIYGDVMNTDMLLHELYQVDKIRAALEAGGINFGSGSKVFQWLEDNADILKDTAFAGWSHNDTVKYMVEHHEELGYETRVDGNGKSYLVDADGNVLNMDGTEASMSLDELTGRTGGDDVITGSGADDFIFGQEGDDIISGGLGNDTLYGGTGDDILFGDEDKLSEIRSVLGISEGSDAPDIIEAIKGAANDEDALTKFINAVAGEGNGGDDQLFGGSGDDLLFGMGGNDYLSGGEGEDFLFGGSGNDIIVYDKNDYLVDGGSGIDFMVSDDNTLMLDDILDNKDTKAGPLVNSIEVLITGEGALDLTNINQLAEKYGITLGENADGEETLSLDMSKWTQDSETNTYTSNDGRLTLETNLERVDMDGQDDAQIQQHMFILQNGQGS